MFKNKFNEIRPIGGGAFSTVFEVKSKIDGKSYAIKKVPISYEEKEKSLKEIQLLRYLKSNFVVYYISSWIEDNYYLESFNADNSLGSGNLLFSPYKPLLLHIQMEMCSMSLSQVIRSFDHDRENIVTPEYFEFACEILMQLLEAINYLHTLIPPIIHRDLKPENILIQQSDEITKVKLADFGLSTYHSFIEESHTKYVGTQMYRAPETNERYYTTKTDIYSLGMVIMDLFNLSFNEEFIEFNPIINPKYLFLKDITLKCLNVNASLRPDCNELIKTRHLWYLGIESFNFEDLVNTSKRNLFDKIEKVKEMKKSDTNEKPEKFEKNKIELSIWNPSNLVSYLSEQNKYRDDEIDENLSSKYKNKFIDLCNIGNGVHGQVWKAMKVADKKTYAIKKIKIMTNDLTQLNEYVKREITILSELNDTYVVKFYESFIDNNYYIEKPQTFPYIMHIQMELCPFTLEDFTFKLLNPSQINRKDKISNVKHSHKLFKKMYDENTELLNFVGYYVSSEIFIEILECVDYLHNCKPEVMHRDLKPANILLTHNVGSNRFVKLADFGLAKLQDYAESNSIGVGTYPVPDLVHGDYNTKCDIYVLHYIVSELFNININSETNNHNLSPLFNKYNELENLIIEMSFTKSTKRPNSSEILKMKHKWSLSFDEANKDGEFKSIMENSSKDSDIIEKFLQFFIVTKSKSSSQKKYIHNAKNEKIDYPNLIIPEYFNINYMRNQYRNIEIDGNLYTNYNSKFTDLCIIGGGLYGQVWKAMKVTDKKTYAIKKIKLLTNDFNQLDKQVKREVQFLSNLKDTYIVKYYDSWIDYNYYVDLNQKYTSLMHIQMELCPITLEDITFSCINPKQLNNRKNKTSNMKNTCKLFEILYDERTNLLSFVGYYVISEILIEVLECIDYLHKCEPQVVHRNLKPSNILITYNGTNRFVKLADFSLATLHEYENQSHTLGVGTYTCPDVMYGKYNSKTDIYLLHYIISEMFNINVNSEINTKSHLQNKYSEILNLITDMSNIISKKRPNCATILQNKHLWGLSYAEAYKDDKFKSILAESHDYIDLADNFIQIYIQTKSKFLYEA